MDFQKVHSKIQEYLRNDWRIEEGDDECFLYWLISPSGSIFRDRYLKLNICNFCDDECLGDFHSEECRIEENHAKEFLELLERLPCYDPTLLDLNWNKESYFRESGSKE